MSLNILGGNDESQPEHHEWGASGDGPRILIENPDRAELWAHEEVLRDAGYEVASCVGPARVGAGESGRRTCPLLTDGECSLVSGADVVISTTSLGDSRAILATLSARISPRLIVEGTKLELARNKDVTPDAIEVAQPVTPDALLAAVAKALATRPATV